MKKILVTGGAGFIASNLINSLLATGKYFVVAVDNFLTGNRLFISTHPNYKFIECDVNNYSEINAVFTTENFNYIFHYAALVGVLRTTENPGKVLDDIKGLQNIFKLAKVNRVERIFYSSSSEVYGEPVHLPQNEYETPLNSRLPYAVVKNIGECFCKSYLQQFGMEYTIFRFFNTYGPGQSEDFVISKFISAALTGTDITIYGDGTQTRTFCYIDDNIDFTMKVLEGNLFINDVVNVGSDNLTSMNELAALIKKVSRSYSNIINLPPLKEGDMSRRQPDNSRMQKILGRNLIPLELGITKLIYPN